MRLNEFSRDLRQLSELLSDQATQKNVVWACSVDCQKQYYLNSAYEAIWGESVQSLIDRPSHWIETLLPIDAQRIKQELASRAEFGFSQQKPLPYRLLFRVCRPDGSLRYIRDVSYFLYNKHGTPVAMVGYGEVLEESQWHALLDSSTRPDDFLTCLVDAVREHIHLSIQPKDTLDFDQITLRERECLRHLSRGKTAKSIAQVLDISPRTVEKHLSHLREKLGAHTKMQLIEFYHSYF